MKVCVLYVCLMVKVLIFCVVMIDDDDVQSNKSAFLSAFFFV